MAAGLAFMDIELRNPFNMRLKTLKNLQMTQTFQKHPSKMRNLAIQRARTGVCTNPAKALNHLRVVLQNAINREIATVIKHYMDVYFTPTVRNIKDNCGDTAVTDEHIVFICRQILEEAQKMYQIPHVSSTTASPSFRMLVIDDGCTSTPSKRKADELLADEDGSDISGSTPYAEATTSTSLAAGSHRKVRMLAVDQSPQQRSSSSTPLSQRFQDITQEDIPKYNPDRIKCDTMFIMGSTANKVLGMGTQRGKIYTKHPGLFRYVGDQEDRVWLFDQRLLTRFGGKAYIMVFHDIEELTRSSEYKQNANLKYHELRGFVAPDFMLTKIRKMMQRDYDELLRKFGGNFTDMSLHIVPNGI